MDFLYIILTPFSWLLRVFYDLTGTYGVALILFTLIIKVILFPLSLKGKKSMIKVNMLNGQMQKLQKMYGKNQEKYQMELQKLYEKENVNPMSGCLWTLVPMFILIPLYAIIRQPIKYMMGVVGDEAAVNSMLQAIAQTVNWDTVAVEMNWITQKVVEDAVKAAADAGTTYVTSFTNMGYNQLYLASLITPDNLASVQAAVAAAGTPAGELFSINFSMLGLNLSQIPQLTFWAGGLSWNSIGLFLIPIISAVVAVVMSLVTNKTNNLNSQQGEQAMKTNMMMMLISPIMYLFFGFSMPGALSIYLLSSSMLGIVQELICGQLLKKDYEKARIEQAKREAEEKEEAKRLKEEARQERARRLEEERKGKGKKKPAPKKKEDEPSGVNKDASRVGLRAYARGRAYDPYRFSPDGPTPYQAEIFTVDDEAVEKALEKKAEEKEKAEFAAKYQLTEEELQEVEQAAQAAVEETVSETGEEAGETPEEDGAGEPRFETPKYDAPDYSGKKADESGDDDDVEEI